MAHMVGGVNSVSPERNDFARLGATSAHKALLKMTNTPDNSNLNSAQEKTVAENLGPTTSVSTMRRNRGLLSNTGSETLG